MQWLAAYGTWHDTWTDLVWVQHKSWHSRRLCLLLGFSGPASVARACSLTLMTIFKSRLMGLILHAQENNQAGACIQVHKYIMEWQLNSHAENNLLNTPKYQKHNQPSW